MPESEALQSMRASIVEIEELTRFYREADAARDFTPEDSLHYFESVVGSLFAATLNSIDVLTALEARMRELENHGP